MGFRNAKILKLQKSRRIIDGVSNSTASSKNGQPEALRAKSTGHLSNDSGLKLTRSGWSLGRMFGRGQSQHELNKEEDNERKHKGSYLKVAVNGEGLSEGTTSDEEDD